MINTLFTKTLKRHRGVSLASRSCVIMSLSSAIAIAIVTVFSPTISVSALGILPSNRDFPSLSSNFPNRNNMIIKRRLLMVSKDTNDSSSDTTKVVDKLMELVEKEDPDNSAIRDIMTNLSSNAENYVFDENSSSSLFNPLVGYYNVSCTLTSRPNDNPVGGKWTRGLWTVKRTMQHVLPPIPVTSSLTNESGDFDFKNKSEAIRSKAVAQVLNAIRLELLWGFVGVWVLLRGDAVPLKLDPVWKKDNDQVGSGDSKKNSSSPKLLPDLSDRTVKAYFDRPRIGLYLRNRRTSKAFFKRVLTLGPTSAVVLDTPYADNRIRLGKGGTSGSQFVFSRLPETDNEARDGWKWVIEAGTKNVGPSLTKSALVLRLGVLGLVLGICSRIVQQRWMKVLAGVYAVISGISIFGLVRSTGGIETEGNAYMMGKQK